MTTASKKLLSKAEGQIFDRKAAEYDLRKLANILVSFANADGGTVAIGIKKNQFEGINHLDSHKINDFLQVGYDLVKPALEVKSEFQDVEVDDKPNQILLLTVASSSEYVYSNTKDEVYLRIGDESKKLTYQQILSLNYSKGIRSYEHETVETALLSDLDQELLDSYKELNHFEGDDVWKLLFSKGFANREMISDDRFVYKLNVGGVLMFAEIPTAFVPGARVRFIRYGGTKAGVGENLDVIKSEMIEGPLPKVIERADAVVKAQLREFMSLNLETGKFETVPEYPSGTWLEGIVNAVTHRAYNLNGDDIRIIMYDDRLIIHSPGNLPSIVTVDNIRTTHYSRNPNIARALSLFGWVREFGEGVDRMYKNMEQYFLEDPEYIVNDISTELILRNNIIMRNSRRKEEIEKLISYDLAKLSYPERAALVYAYDNKELRPKEFIESNPKVYESSARKALSSLVEKNLLERHSSFTTSPNTYYTLKKQS